MALITSIRRSALFKKLSELGEWSREAQRECHRAANDLDAMTAVIRKQLEATGRGRFDVGQSRWQAARAVRQWRRAVAHLDAASDCMARGWRDVQERYDPQASRTRANGKTIDVHS